MEKPNPNRQAITEQVRREIAQHKAGEIERFTATDELSRAYNRSVSSIRNYLLVSAIPKEDLRYRAHSILSAQSSEREFSEETREKLSRYRKRRRSPSRQEIIEQVQREIKQHKAGEIERFTTIVELTERYKLSRTYINTIILHSPILKEDLRYRTNKLYSERMSGKGNPHYRVVHSQETKRKISEARKGIQHSEETRRKISEAMSGEGNPNHGKVTPEETRRKISEAMSGERNPCYKVARSEETRRKNIRSPKRKNSFRRDKKKAIRGK